MEQELLITKLAHTPEAAKICATWLHDEWGYRRADSSLAISIEKFKARANIDELPIAFVAISDGQPVGTVSLVATEDAADTVGPWIGSVFVPSPKRGLGIARKLIEVAEKEAARLDFQNVWLSAAAPGMYQKLGYTFTDETRNGEPVMVKRLR
ncbi:GNAT family N-acetyltransferase [Rhizobium leguminosarum]|uniref:GNAT family N-acetyltransferase n=1 Tax=Rhizobium leguminosarum TaxID=384 RepID=UPI0024A9F6F4|nr:GNAT family N-acetyltransferase [Rhizobium leguminosarum]MDI5927757.1 GNAT family N-acetyltransferase [Rhizobium leguminosarum]